VRRDALPGLLTWGTAGLTLAAGACLAVGLTDLAALVGGTVPLFVAAFAAGASE
jgi:uncharacterized membrane protein YphA (DoxX/SURF4 family)